MTRAKMTGWYDPLQLVRTGADIVLSTVFASRDDFRQIEALADPQPPYRYDGDELWFDFMADTGDGWNSTFTVASLLARPTLTLDGKETPRGRLLVLGSDEVYPVAGRDAYEQKFVQPFTCAATAAPGADGPELFAIPGNHDWYDGLGSFMRLFCQQRAIGTWRTRQSRSYFAVQLPHRWWMIAVDIQLESDIDKPQIDYFLDVASRIQAGDRLILVTAEPDWVHAATQETPAMQRNVAFLFDQIFQRTGARLALRLTGDLHHYRRHERADGKVHNIIAGGGGAFMHPTHGPNVEPIVVSDDQGQAQTYHLKKSFPDERTSRRLTWGNLGFSFKNPRFAFTIAALYLMLSWTMPRATRVPSLRLLIKGVIEGFIATPLALAWSAFIIGGFMLFTDTQKKWYRYLGGGAHGAAHLLAALLVAWSAHLIVHPLFGENRYVALAAVVLVKYGLAFFVGSTVMGVYLLVSLNLFRRHANEAFSSLRIEDYKNFLRLHIDPSGALTIYPIGIRKVPRRWTQVQSPGAGAPSVVPNAPIEPFLIEPPIRID